jgi:hypothetical protein
MEGFWINAIHEESDNELLIRIEYLMVATPLLDFITKKNKHRRLKVARERRNQKELS